MDLLHALQIERDFNAAIIATAPPPRGRRAKRRTCEVFFNEMCDFEFLRTFRYSKEAVRHLTKLLGK